MKIKEYKYSGQRDLSVFGAFSVQEQIRFVITASDLSYLAKIIQVSLVIHGDGWNSGRERRCMYFLTEDADGTWVTELSMEELCRTAGTEGDRDGLFYYHYCIIASDGTVSYWGGEKPAELLPLSHDGQGERQILVYRAEYQPPLAFGEGIVYHIFVDRFHKTGIAEKYLARGAVLDSDWENGIPQYGEKPGADVANNVFFGGDLYGVAEKLDYIASLGTATIYLSPIFTAASNHKYDIGDYLSVDPMFGGDKALSYLCKEAKNYGIKIMLDGVFNHTGADSIYFNKQGTYSMPGAYQSPESPWAEWYTFYRFPEDYECWWGIPILPRVNSGNRAFRTFICGKVIPKWMRMGVWGWRLDVADELQDSLLEDLRRSVRKEEDGGAIIGEVWEDASDKVSYGQRRKYFRGEQLDGVMNYPLRAAIMAYILQGDAEALRQGTEYLYRRYPKWASDNQMNFLGTHDTVRILTALGGEPEGTHTNGELARMQMTEAQRELAKSRLKTAYALLAAMPGVPCVFYGDEAGLEGYRDPFCRRPFPWHGICTDLLEWFRKIGEIRKKESLLRTGVFRLLYADEKGTLFIRTPWEGESCGIVIAVNRSRKDLCFFVPVTGKDWITDTVLSAGCHPLVPGQVIYFRCPAEFLTGENAEDKFSLAEYPYVE